MTEIEMPRRSAHRRQGSRPFDGLFAEQAPVRQQTHQAGDPGPVEPAQVLVIVLFEAALMTFRMPEHDCVMELTVLRLMSDVAVKVTLNAPTFVIASWCEPAPDSDQTGLRRVASLLTGC